MHPDAYTPLLSLSDSSDIQYGAVDVRFIGPLMLLHSLANNSVSIWNWTEGKYLEVRTHLVTSLVYVYEAIDMFSTRDSQTRVGQEDLQSYRMA